MAIENEKKEQIERFFRKRILQEMTEGNPLSSIGLVREAQEKFYLFEVEDAITLNVILNEVWDLMSKNISGEEKDIDKQKGRKINREKYEAKQKVLSYLYDNPYATPEEIADKLGMSLKLLEELFPENNEKKKTRFSPKQKIMLTDATVGYLSQNPNATIEDIEDLFFKVFQSKVNVKKVLTMRSIELEQKGDKKTSKILKEFLIKSQKTRDEDEGR